MDKSKKKPEAGTGAKSPERELDKTDIKLLKEAGTAYDGGTIRLSDLCANTGISIDEAKNRMTDLASERLVNILVGGEEYRITTAGIQKVIESYDSEITKSI